MSEVVKKLFAKDIQANLYPKNEFYKNSKVDAGVLADVTEVEVPQSGGNATIVENPSSFPLAISPRTDDVKKYPVDVLATLPIRIEDDNELVLSYSKRKDVIESNVNSLNTRIADKMAYVWSPSLATNIVRTSGADAPAKLAGATGTRKLLTVADWVEAHRILGNMDCPDENFKALMSANFLAELRNAGINGFVGSDKLSSDLLEKGVIAKFFNTEIFNRSRTCRFDNTGTPVKKVYTAANGTTDNDSILLWHPQMVRRAEGVMKLYANMDAGEYLGSHFNGKIRAGGTAARLDQAGVVSIVQAHGA